MLIFLVSSEIYIFVIYQMNKIVVVDPEPDNLHILKYILENEGHTVIAESIFDNRHSLQDIRLLILDAGVLGKGIEYCAKLKQDHRTMHIPILIMSVIPSVEQQAITAQANAFLEKPFDITAFTELVKELICSSKS